MFDIEFPDRPNLGWALFCCTLTATMGIKGLTALLSEHAPKAITVNFSPLRPAMIHTYD
jgi:hypothetical protein